MFVPIAISAALTTPQAPQPGRSVFLPASVVAAARANIARHGWARKARDRIVAAAAPWLSMSDDQLWSLMFGSTIKRSWMVWSNGHCPSCKRDVPMYTWEVSALDRPWKVRCPHCKELFPRNDFAKYHASGLDRHGVFDPSRADRSLLYNTEHPDANDPLRGFGVDDGEGYAEGDKRWRFIGAYLIYGQWKQAIVAGVRSLADAYTITGDPAYAHKAGILLDRVADLYPTFDFGKQGVMYEGPPSAGYVSTWHDACEETRWLVLAYDQVREALAADSGLAAFLSDKARRFELPNPKTSWADVRRNIEDGILRDALTNRQRIHSNYPRTEIALATISMALGWPGNRDEVFAIVNPMMEKATAVDGVTGEKGLAGYSAYTIQGVAGFLAQLARLDPALLDDLLLRHPRIRDMFRFHVDTWCMGTYYPQTGDTGAYASTYRRYAGASFSTLAGIEPSMFTLMILLHRTTRDPAFAQLAYLANSRSAVGLPHDLFRTDGMRCEREVDAAVRRNGAEPIVGSVNKEQWRLAILRSGTGLEARTVWLDYDAGGGHGHADALNIGMFAYGLDLLPELGYPPVQFGGWGSPRARWYTMTAAHNTVVVDGRNQEAASGDCTLWADGEAFHAVRARCPEAAQVGRCERTVALCDVGPEAAYVVDILRAQGGSEHALFQHSHFGTLTLAGVELKPEADYGHGTQMRDLRMGGVPGAGFVAEWEADDRMKLLPPGRKVYLRHHDLTENAEAGTCEGWIAIGGYNATEEVWIPRLVVRRRGADLSSTFVSVLEPHTGAPAVLAVKRLSLAGTAGGDAATVALEVQRADGSRDVIVAPDPEGDGGELQVPALGLSVWADLCRATLDRSGRLAYVAVTGCRRLKVGGLELRGRAQDARSIVELRIHGRRVRVVRGREHVLRLVWRGRAVSP